MVTIIHEAQCDGCGERVAVQPGYLSQSVVLSEALIEQLSPVSFYHPRSWVLLRLQSADQTEQSADRWFCSVACLRDHA